MSTEPKIEEENVLFYNYNVIGILCLETLPVSENNN